RVETGDIRGLPGRPENRAPVDDPEVPLPDELRLSVEHRFVVELRQHLEPGRIVDLIVPAFERHGGAVSRTAEADDTHRCQDCHDSYGSREPLSHRHGRLLSVLNVCAGAGPLSNRVRRKLYMPKECSFYTCTAHLSRSHVGTLVPDA